MLYTRCTSFSKVVRRKIFNIQSGTAMTDYLRIYKIVIKYLSVIVLVFVYTINFSIDGRSIRIRCTTLDFALFLEVSVHFVLALCNIAPDILKLIEKVVRRRRTTLKSGTALAVPAVPGMPPLVFLVCLNHHNYLPTNLIVI